MRKLVVLPVLALFAFGCGAEIKLNPTAKFPLPVSEEAPAFLFPINLNHLGSKGDPALMGVSVTAGIVAKYGKQVVSGQQLFDLVGNLSWELAETIDAQARANTFAMTGAAEQIATALSNLMEQIVQKLVDLKLLDKLGSLRLESFDSAILTNLAKDLPLMVGVALVVAGLVSTLVG